jgi:hypothetical protein
VKSSPLLRVTSARGGSYSSGIGVQREEHYPEKNKRRRVVKCAREDESGLDHQRLIVNEYCPFTR